MMIDRVKLMLALLRPFLDVVNFLGHWIDPAGLVDHQSVKSFMQKTIEETYHSIRGCSIFCGEWKNCEICAGEMLPSFLSFTKGFVSPDAPHSGDIELS